MRGRDFLLVALMAAAPLHAASIGGRVSYPGEGLPQMIVVAREISGTGAAYFTEVTAGNRYRIEVPAGRYVVYAVARLAGANPGQEPRGAHTMYSICERDRLRTAAGRCVTGPLEELNLGAADKREDVNVDDWLLPQSVAATLPLPTLFQRYAVDYAPPLSPQPPDFEGAPAAVKMQRTRIQRAASRGPYLAGRAAVARWECGAGCENWALVDITTGRILWVEDPGVQPLRRNYPCDVDPLQFRADSRLLRVHRSLGSQVVTQDYLWSVSQARLEKAGETIQSAEEFCKSAKP